MFFFQPYNHRDSDFLSFIFGSIVIVYGILFFLPRRSAGGPFGAPCLVTVKFKLSHQQPWWNMAAFIFRSVEHVLHNFCLQLYM